MKTQCPHCQAKFNIADTHEGKKVTCQKCSNSYTVTSLDESTENEICTRCARTIAYAERACVFENKIVCSECDQILRKSTKSMTSHECFNTAEAVEGLLSDANASKLSNHQARWLKFREANKINITVGFLLLLATIPKLCEQPVYQGLTPWSPRPYEWLNNWYISLEPMDYEEGHTLDELAEDLHRLKNFIDAGILLVIGVCLLFRSFLPNFKFYNWILIFVGGVIIGFPVGSIGFSFIRWGPRAGLESIGVQLIISLVGVVPLWFGFKVSTAPLPEDSKQ